MGSLQHRLCAGLLSGLLLLQLVPFGLAQALSPATGSPERAIAEPSLAQIDTPPLTSDAGGSSPPGSDRPSGAGQPSVPPRPDASREPRRTQPGTAAQPDRSVAQDAPEPRLPKPVTSQHVVALPDRTLRFSATAVSIRLADPQGSPQADIGVIAYRLDGQNPRERPVTFVLNGGPGAASAWLQLGALGPWRLPMTGEARLPSAVPSLLPNAETWLDFTDLVFIDPAGTGYSRILGNDDVRKRLWSVDGDIQSLAEVVRRWLEENGRTSLRKFLVGESYGGFRAPRLARTLASDQGVGLAGLVLVSPALEINRQRRPMDPLSYVARLPSMAAVTRARQGAVDRAMLIDAERYAAGDFLVDLLRGVRDTGAIDRLNEHVAALTGLDGALVRRRYGRIGPGEFLREVGGTGKVASVYDATVHGVDPFPGSENSQHPDPVLDALIAPLTGAMQELYADKLTWRPAGQRYEALNRDVSREWDWGRGGHAEAVSSLRTALALDPTLRVLIVHGLFDLVTPYFGTQLILNQISAESGGDRVRLSVWPGGHMMYGVDASRAALRDEGRRIIESHRR
jgi:carboxypeptidase C (cathepsin A)